MSKKSRRRRAHPSMASGALLPASAAERKLNMIESVLGEDPPQALELLEAMADRYHLSPRYYLIKSFALLKTEGDVPALIRTILQAEPEREYRIQGLRLRGIVEAANGDFAAAY